MAEFDLKASFVTFGRRRELDDLLRPLARIGPQARIVETAAGNCIQWSEIEPIEPVENEWCISKGEPLTITSRTFISETRHGWTAITISPKESSVIAAQEVLARWADGHALDIEVPVTEFFDKITERFYNFEQFAQQPRPNIAFGGVILGVGDTTIALDLGTQQVPDLKMFQSEVVETWLRLAPSFRFKAAYLAIDGVPANVFGNGTAILDAENVTDAVHTAQALSVLFDFQLMPA
jgi:hypothetical protein